MATAAEIRAQAVTIGMDQLLLELVNVRASQVNACAFGLDVHSRRALETGESAQRLAALRAWRETALFSDAERGPGTDRGSHAGH